MGAIAAIGGIASAVIGARSAKKAAQTQAAAMDRATEASQQGFRYLRDNPLNQQAQAYGGQAMGMRNALLGIGGDPAQAQAAFQQYQDSTGYQFRLGQGMSAISQNAAASGLLGSGATAKALMQYGQDIGSAEFGNYLGYLGQTEQTGLEAAANVAAQGQASGQSAAAAIQTGASNVAQMQMQRGREISSGIGMAVSGLTDWYNSRR